METKAEARGFGFHLHIYIFTLPLASVLPALCTPSLFSSQGMHIFLPSLCIYHDCSITTSSMGRSAFLYQNTAPQLCDLESQHHKTYTQLSLECSAVRLQCCITKDTVLKLGVSSEYTQLQYVSGPSSYRRVTISPGPELRWS